MRAAQEGSARFEEAADPPTPSSTATGYTDITDGKETEVAEVRYRPRSAIIFRLK